MTNIQTVKAYFDGNAFVPVGQIKATENQRAVVTLLDDMPHDDIPENYTGKAYLRYAGALSDESCAEIEAIKKSTREKPIIPKFRNILA